jgi:chemotaxis protein MotB
MATKITTAILLLVIAGIMISCGAGKKLEAANSQIADLQSKNSQLSSQNSQLNTDVSNLKKQVSDLSTQSKTINDQFNSYKKECQANEKELADMQAAMNELSENFAKLENRLQTALADFKDRGLDVFSKDGVIYVDMQDNLLYKVGSASLKPDGKKALGSLASVLNDYPKLEVIVVGNTDTTSIKGVADNWSLSTERANGVVRVLVKDNKVDPGRIISAGRSKFHPIADNSTAEGKAKNRRTEIVLNPDWDRIWQTVKKDAKSGQ